MVGKIGVVGVSAARFVTDNALSVLQVHCVGLGTTPAPASSSLQNNCAVLGVEFETLKMLITLAIPDLNLTDLSLWLAALNAGPVIFGSLCATIGTIHQSELVLPIVG